MKKTNKPIKIIVYLLGFILLGVLSNIFHFSTSFGHYLSNISVNPVKIISLLSMIFIVLFVEEVAKFILSLIKSDKHRTNTLITVLASSIRYIAAIVIICWGLSIVGVDVATIASSIGILALIIGFGAESLIEDTITGIFMLFENQYNVGDIIEVSGFRGVVTEIGIRTTSIKDTSDNIKIINNSLMKNVLNKSDNKSISVCDIGVPYNTDIEMLEKKLPVLLEEIRNNNPDIMVENPEYLGVQKLADSAIVLRFIAKVAEKDLYSGERALNHDLLLLFRKNGIECPFPQMDIHSK